MVYHKPRRSCLDCRRRHLKCSLPDSGGSASCVWCQEHGLECVKDWETSESNQLLSQPAKDGAIILNGSNSAFGGFQLSKTNLIAGDKPNKSRLLRLRHDVALQHRSSTSPWVGGDGDTDQELRLDKPVAAYLKQLFFSNVQPYIPIIGAAYFGSIEPTQLLLSAMYGVAARLPGAIVSTRDFLHIKRVFEHQLKNQMTRYKPSLQACQALTLIHLTLEMQCEGLEGVETWPLRLSAAVRMAFELRLHRKESYAHESPLLQETKRRLFWAIFCKDRWTSTGKGYPLMIDTDDVDVDLPSPLDLDDPSCPPHEFFTELIQQSIALGRIHPVCFSADQFANVSIAQFRLVEANIDMLGQRIRDGAQTWDPVTRAHLEINYATIRLLFYGPFFKPSSDAETALFAALIPDISGTRLRLASDAVRALDFASRELLSTGPSIWSIMFYAQVRCFLVALSIKHDPITDYSPQLRAAATSAVAKVSDIARYMCEDKRWCFMVLSGTLALFTKRVAEDKDAVKRLPTLSGRVGKKKNVGRKRRATDSGIESDMEKREIKREVKKELVVQTDMMSIAGSSSTEPESAVEYAGEASVQLLDQVVDIANWDLGNDYSEDIDWQEWDMMFSRIVG